jgi:hypothetical protein
MTMTVDSDHAERPGHAPEAAGECLALLSAAAIEWTVSNLRFFNPYSETSASAEHRKVKAALELALISACWTRLDAGGGRLDEATALIQMLWQLPDFQQLISSQPDHAGQYELIYAALAPAGIDAGLRDAALARLEASGHLLAAGKSAYTRLETRFYADKAGARHELPSYEELIEQNILVRLPEKVPVTITEAYTITHSSFYVSDFGFRRPALAPQACERARHLVSEMLDYCAGQDMWDLTAELLITLACLGANPLDMPAGLAGLRCLRRAQLPDGAIPGRSAAQRPEASASAAEFFHKSYHTTLAVILMSVIVSPKQYRS